MGNLILSFKKMIINKTTVTVFGLIICVGIIFVCYNNRVKSSINPITVPYAKTRIAAGTQITSKMVGTTQVPPSMLEGDVLTSVAQVIDKYSNADTVIPEGSLFYDRTVVEKDELPANIILDYPTGYVLYNMSVTTETTYGNIVYPGNYIDIYLKVETRDITGQNNNVDNNTKTPDKILYGKLLSHVKILSVKDTEGRPVFKNKTNESETREPAMIIFAIPKEYYILLSKASYLRTYSSTLVPVPTNEALKEEQEEVEMSSETLKTWINNITYWIEQ